MIARSNRNRTVGTLRLVHGVRVRQTIDLTEHLTINEFDNVVRALEATVRRGKVFDRVLFALGGVVVTRGDR